MPNPLFQTFGNNRQPNMMDDFRRFMQQMQGKNPHEEIAKLLQSGQISQAQLDQAQQMASQFSSQFKW